MCETVEMNSKYTFWQLLNEFNIVIPIIQRDYAQGRNSNNVTIIRDELLDSIYSALINKDGLDFDFVYGSVEGDVLYPLDGQQRLTTFYLLHWYLAEKEGKIKEAAKVLSKFSYETRISSREFCSLLNEIEYIPQEDESVSDFIKNENRYFREWDTDPTISHMLTMLDAIHMKFFDMDDIFDELSSLDKELLTFNFLRMENYALTDDLYIKMNARGKSLSIFENFKAKFIQHLKEKELSNEYFEKCIDGKWTDLLWDYRDYDNTIDEQFMNLFCFITEMLFLETSEPREGESPFSSDDIRGLINYYQNEESVEALYSYLDLWSCKEQAEKFLKSVFTEVEDGTRVKTFEKHIDIFSAVIKGESVSLTSKLLLFSVMKRLVVLGKDTDVDNLRDYTRIVRNFLLNTRSFDKRRCYFSSDLRYGRHALPIMQNYINVLVYEENPYKALANYSFENINSEICELEKQKATIITKSPELKKIIHDLEDLDLFRSSIFNIIPYIMKHIDEYLVNSLIALDEYMDPKLIQALLSIDDYGIKIGSSVYGDRFFYGNTNDWHSIFTYNGGERYIKLISTFVEQLQNTKSENIGERLDEIVMNNLNSINKNDWRYTMVKYYNVIRNRVSEMNFPLYIIAKEKCADGSILIHRINGFIMSGYHVVPEYYEVVEQLRDLCYGDVRSYGIDEDNEGGINLSCVEGLSIRFNNAGEFDINCRGEDRGWVDLVKERYDSMELGEKDKVEKCVILCRMIDEKSKEVYE